MRPIELLWFCRSGVERIDLNTPSTPLKLMSTVQGNSGTSIISEIDFPSFKLATE